MPSPTPIRWPAKKVLERMEIKLAAQEIIRRLDNVRLAIPQAELTYLATLASQTLERLPLTFTRRAG